MARDLSDELEKSLDDSYEGEEGDISAAGEPPKTGFLDFTARSGAAAGVGAAALLVVGLLVGSQLLGGAGEASTQRRSVATVTERLPVFDQLESMRESTISALNSQVAELSEELGKEVPPTSAGASSAVAAVGGARGGQTSAASALLSALISAQVSCDDADKYLNGKYTGTATDGLVSLALVYGGEPSSGDEGAPPKPKLGGSSPGVDTGRVCSAVSSPVLCTVSLGTRGAKVAGSVCVAYVPVATEDGALYNAVYVLGLSSSEDAAGAETWNVDSCRYSGLMPEAGGDPGALQGAVRSAELEMNDLLGVSADGK